MGSSLTGCLALFLATCSSSATDSTSGWAGELPDRFSRQSIEWTQCGDIECSSFKVPIDYESPESGEWVIKLGRLATTGERASQGTLFTNPGGPGIPGVANLVSTKPHWDTLRTAYDVISFDPRGVGGSEPAFNCLSETEKTEIRNQVSAPTRKEDVSRARELGILIGSNCSEQYAEYLPFVGTENVARDIDLLRVVLGEEQLTYFGFSYGTFVGSNYAEMFPGRTRRVVLDSAMNPTLEYPQIRRGQADQFQIDFTRFVNHCDSLPDCPLPGGESEGLTAIQNVIEILDEEPYVAADGRILSGSRALGLMESSMYKPEDGWPILREVIGPALAGDFGPLFRRAYGDALKVNPADPPYLAVMCIDFQMTKDIDAPEQRAPIWAETAPVDGANRAWSVQPCETWPVGPDRAAAPIAASGSGPILVAANVNDPATPYPWSKALSEQLEHARLITWEAGGHIAYKRDSPCMIAAIDEFLLEGRLPVVGTVCPGDPSLR